jgi:uncharacterized protein (TIGR02453 family)
MANNTKTAFEGFNPKGLQFLFENRMNNSKEWYDGHKEIYKQYVYQPMEALILEVAPAVREIDDQLITVPSKIISRVRRDTRFTKDKTLYRDHVWLTFLRDKSETATSPCFWFEIGQKGCGYGVGFYGAEPRVMAAMREMILEGHPAFLAALKGYEAQNRFVIGGETYKRSKYPDQPENLRTWLDRKNIYFECAHNDFKLAFSKELPEALKESYRSLKPIYDFFLAAEHR